MKQVTPPPAQLAEANTAQGLAAQAHQANAQAKVATADGYGWVDHVFSEALLNPQLASPARTSALAKHAMTLSQPSLAAPPSTNGVVSKPFATAKPAKTSASGIGSAPAAPPEPAAPAAGTPAATTCQASLNRPFASRTVRISRLTVP